MECNGDGAETRCPGTAGSKSNGKQWEATATEPKQEAQETMGSKTNGKLREATAMEPKPGAQEPILVRKARTPKSKLCF